jgi:hypothetical protein
VGRSLWWEDGLSFTITAGPCQCSHFRVQVPWDLWPYFTVSDSRLPFSLPPTTHRATVEVFDLVSTWDDSSSVGVLVIQPLCMDRVENTVSNSSSIFVFQLLLVKNMLPSNGCCLVCFYGRCLEMGLYATIFTNNDYIWLKWAAIMVKTVNNNSFLLWPDCRSTYLIAKVDHESWNSLPV